MGNAVSQVQVDQVLASWSVAEWQTAPVQEKQGHGI
jgi:hypothetical protein